MNSLTVRRWGFGLLLAAYVAAATPLGQLLKLPVLVEHFAEHRRENPDISVFGFVVLHYFSGNVRDADYERDMQLPFKSVDLPLSIFSALHFPPEAAATVVFGEPVFRERILPVSLVFPAQPFLATPVQPPEG